MPHDTPQSRRGFLASLGAIVVAGSAAPSILARLRRPSVADDGPIIFRDNVLTAPAERSVMVTMTTSAGTYRAPIVDGVADFSHVIPKSAGWMRITSVYANGSPWIPGQIKL